MPENELERENCRIVVLDVNLIPRDVFGPSGTAEELLIHYGLTPAQLVQAAEPVMRRKQVMSPGRLLREQHGVTLLTVLVMVVVLGLALGLAGSSWRSIMQRVKEEELLWRGDQYRRAIGSYYSISQSGVQRYPAELQDLLRDPRSLQTMRHLRRLYPDPMTGGDWVIIKDPAGGIKGVHSSSNDQPFKTDGFPKEYEQFKDRTKYSEWEFFYQPEQTSTRSASGVTSSTSGGSSVN